MKTAYIVRKGQVCNEPKAEAARENFGYLDQDVVVVLDDDIPCEIHVLRGLKNMFENEVTNLEDAIPLLTRQETV